MANHSTRSHYTYNNGANIDEETIKSNALLTMGCSCKLWLFLDKHNNNILQDNKKNEVVSPN